MGSALDVVVKMNGIKRLPPVYSTCQVTLTGTAHTAINNGIVADKTGNNWSIPSPTVLDSTGTITVIATCQTPGPINANPGDINQIMTPTYGWSTVNNTAAATPGSFAETDAQLRARQAISTATPSQTILEGIKSAISSLSGVGRYQIYENDTASTDSNGLPAHSLTAVVENGADQDIAQVLFAKKAPGVATNGTTSISIVDVYGVPSTINFYRPSYVDIDVTINVKQLTGYTTDVTTTIQNNVATFISSLAIGDDLAISSLWGAALSANAVPIKPVFSITGVTAARHGGTQGTADLVIAFNEVTRGNTANITINAS
jgi:uncharacterized phage protein gp47/JayE